MAQTLAQRVSKYAADVVLLLSPLSFVFSDCFLSCLYNFFLGIALLRFGFIIHFFALVSVLLMMMVRV